MPSLAMTRATIGASATPLSAGDKAAISLSASIHSGINRSSSTFRKSQGDEFFVKTRNGKHSPSNLNHITEVACEFNVRR